MVRSELALLQARADEIDAEERVLTTQALQATEAAAEAGAAARALALLAEETAMIAPLVQARLEPEVTLFTLRRLAAEAEGRRDRALATLARQDAAGTEIADRRRALHARIASESRSELAAAEAELAELDVRLPLLAGRLARTQLRAPMRGVINRLLPSGRDAVVQGGQVLAELVPLDEGLRIEAWVRPADIAFLHPGQPVRVRLTAYDSSRYGAMEGRIERLGADAVRRPDREEMAYAVQVRTEGALTGADGAELDLMPGMIAEIDILNGRKTVLDYLIRPILRTKETAFRD